MAELQRLTSPTQGHEPNPGPLRQACIMEQHVQDPFQLGHHVVQWQRPPFRLPGIYDIRTVNWDYDWLTIFPGATLATATPKLVEIVSPLRTTL